MPHFLEYVLPSLQTYSDRVLLKFYTGSPGSPSWSSVTYKTFYEDMERASSYWFNKLKDAGLVQNDVVGLWVSGYKYADLVFMYAISRAGFVPQMLGRSMAVQGQPVVADMLKATGGKVLLYDTAFSSFTADIELPCLPLNADLESLPSLTAPLPSLPFAADDDVAAIFHTSGTTSGKPKPIRETHKWLRCQAQVQWPAVWQGGEKQAVMNNLGSFANVGSATTISYLGYSGQCLIQTSKPDFEPDEFMTMVENGLNHVFVYAPWLSKLISMARSDDSVLSALKNMLQITYTGASLNPEDERWLVANGIRAIVLYATTESGCCLISQMSEVDKIPSMRIIKGIECQLIPRHDVNAQDLDMDSEARAGTGMLYDFYVPESADNCPHPLTRNRPDGHITGDLFEETGPGLYAFRGRSDDWIRTGKLQCFCDTKSIEDNILRVCAGLVENCVAVGHYRPGIVLLFEPSQGDPEDDATMSDLKRQILELHKDFNSRLFEHERIMSTMQIVAVQRGSLPRTMEKGNIRRKAAEDQHAGVLEEIYKKLKTW